MALPERLYYPLEKAAKKLTDEGMPCDVDDLIHFAAHGKLEICARIKDSFFMFGKLILCIAPKWMIELSDDINSDISNLYFETDFGHIKFCERDKKDDFFIKSVSTLFAVHLTRFEDIELSIANGNEFIEVGFFQLPRGYKIRSHFHQIEVDEDLNKIGSEYKLGGGFLKINDYEDDEDILSIKIPASSLVITAKELALLKAGGEPVPQIQQSQTAFNKPHGNAERFAVSRESVLKAAIYCKAHFPDKCADYTSWANTIDEKAPLFWTKTGAPPLEKSVIERLLSDAHKTQTNVK